jgi:hypothetical protein
MVHPTPIQRSSPVRARRAAGEAACTAFVVDCVWPGISPATVDALDGHVREMTRRAALREVRIRYLGALALPGDGLVLFEFLAASADAVAATCTGAGIPFQRVAPAMRTPMEVTP